MLVALFSACAENPNLPVSDSEPLDSAEALVADAANSASGGGLTIRRVSGNGQRGEPGRALPQALVAEVVDGSGKPVSGELLSWIVRTGNGELNAGYVRTDARGRSQVRFTLGTDLTKQRATVRLPKARVTFVAWAEGGGGGGSPGSGDVVVAPKQMEIPVGDSENLTATVYDNKGKAVNSASLTWSTSNKDVASVNSSGSVTAMAPGSATIRAKSGDASATAAVAVVQENNSGGLSIRRVSGNSQKAKVETELSEPLRVKVTNGNGSPAGGKTVQWRVTQGSGSTDRTSTKVDESGHAQVRFTLGKEVGWQKVRAQVSGRRVTFSAEGLAEGTGGGAQQTLRHDGGNNQNGQAGEALQNRIRVQVINESGGAVPGVKIRWNVASGGGSLNNSSTTTDSDGKTGVQWTLGPENGQQRVRVVVDGASDGIAFNATAEGGGSGSSDVQSVRVTPGSFTLRAIDATRDLTATPLDAQGNEVGGISIRWSSSDEGVATVNADGRVRARGEGRAEISAQAECCGSPAGRSTVTVDVGSPPSDPPVSGFPNLPSGYQIQDNNAWDAIPVWGGPLVNGWGKVISAGPGGGPVGEGRVVQDPTAPDGDSNVFRMTFNPGHTAGEDGYGVYRPTGGAMRGYFAYWLRIGEQGDPGSFKRHGNGLKLFSLQNAGGGNLNVHWMDSPRLGNGPICDLVAFDSWDRQSSSWSGPHNDPSCAHAGEMDYWLMGAPNGGPKLEIGKWTLIELLWGPDSIQWFMDGREVAEYRKSGNNGFNGMGSINITGTWGGGSSSVPSPQSYYIARSIIAIP